MAARAQRERRADLAEALSVIESVFADSGLFADFVSTGSAEFPVHRCTVRDSAGRVRTASLGKGAGAQSRVSALFEAWQHLQHEEGQAALAGDRRRARALPVAEVVAQPELRGEEMIHRLARDYPDIDLACLRAEPLTPGRAVLWYPAFARSPSCRSHPIPGDDLRYEPYLRYAYDSGTATGVTEPEAVLHGLLEVVERDALSHALLDWYLDGRSRISALAPHVLPPDLRRLHREATTLLGSPPLIIDITSDLGIPVYCALSSRAGPYPGVIGSGASLSPDYAVERALTEVVQSSFNMSLGVDLTLDRRLEGLRRWPLLERCARLDPAPLIGRLSCDARLSGAEPESAGGHGPERDGGHGPERDGEGQVADVDGQIGAILQTLERAGFSAYSFRWNPAHDRCPVLTVIVPGLETFAMVHSAIPVFPTGRAVRRLTAHR
ncbi:YcaO-like family protein [Streptosporangium sp. CA-135522]|uniref:YcaO-like family protein n=1 Tax=Streptosporangium sp. CA-135522 TaxID=3240072 RepID=UPI003D8E52F3